MSGQVVSFTNGPLVLSASPYDQEAAKAIDTLGSTGRLTVLFRVYSTVAVPMTTPTMTLYLYSAMTQSTNGADWVTLETHSFTPSVGPAGDTIKIDVSDLPLRYVRWSCTFLDVASTVVEVTGVLW